MNDDDAWDVGFGRWETYFGLVLASTLIYVGSENDSWPAGAVAAVLLAAMVPWYLLLGRRTLSRRSGALVTCVYAAGMITLSSAACFAAPQSALMLFALCPQCFMVAEWRLAGVGIVLLNAAPAARFLQGGPGAGSIVAFMVWTVVTIAFSLLFGVWIERIIAQSSERRELIQKLEATRAELAQVSREAGVLAERERLAAEIHDTLAQGFTSILMLLQAVEPQIGLDPAEARRQIALATRTARENLAEARALVAAVPPAALGDASLDEAVRRLADRLGEELDLDAECVVSGAPRRLEARSEVVLLRAAQEGLANVRKHAKADRVGVSLAYRPTTVRLEVRDDGAGFDPETVSGFGLRGMRDRAAQVDGTLDVHSTPGEGTTIALEVPG
jgi:signal transduction histidine kinase